MEPRRNVGAMAPWWRGARGEWYVVAQVVLMALIFLGPRSLPGLPRWPSRPIVVGVGLLLIVVGGLFFSAAVFGLGRNLTPLPHPKADATLTTTGPYRLVRHPIYCGGLVISFGWALLVHSWTTLLFALLLLLLFDRKARREERWLEEKFPGYAAYRRRVRRLIPFVY